MPWWVEIVYVAGAIGTVILSLAAVVVAVELGMLIGLVRGGRITKW